MISVRSIDSDLHQEIEGSPAKETLVMNWHLFPLENRGFFPRVIFGIWLKSVESCILETRKPHIEDN